MGEVTCIVGSVSIDSQVSVLAVHKMDRMPMSVTVVVLCR